jgi:RND superfamily putative drug exporter
VLLVLAAPVLRLELGFPTAGQNPESSLTRQAYDISAEKFGAGANGVLIVSATQDGGLDQQALAALAAALQTDGVVYVAPPMANPAGDTAVISVVPATGPTDQATRDLVQRLRTDVIPSAVADSNITAYVGGQTAGIIDLEERIVARTPVFFMIVIGLSFLILMVVFRSILIPIKAALMNIFSIVSAFGVVVAVFQFGWGADLIGVTPGPIAVFMPMFLFAILFGLSMDYEVFLLSRIRESWAHSGDTRHAVGEGLAATARVITAAAAIMVAVFLSFVFQNDPIPQQFGLGLAVAVLVDASIVRLILVPATMELLGDRNWWYPAWLDRITPRLNIEGGPAPAPASANAAPAD